MTKGRKHLDLSGQKFGKLLALSYTGTKGKWLMRCDCGVEKTFFAHRISYLMRIDKVPNCGCVKLVRSKPHGFSNEPWYSTYIRHFADIPIKKYADKMFREKRKEQEKEVAEREKGLDFSKHDLKWEERPLDHLDYEPLKKRFD